MGVTLTVGGRTVALSTPSANVSLTAKAATVSLTTYVPGPKGDTGPAGTSYYELPTNSDIGGNRAVGTSSGYAVYADSSTPVQAVGITMSATSSGENAKVQTGGKMTVTAAGWTPGAPVFLGANGTLTQTEPTSGISQVLGIAHGSDVILIEINQPIRRS